MQSVSKEELKILDAVLVLLSLLAEGANGGPNCKPVSYRR